MIRNAIPNAIYVPASGSFTVHIEEEIDDGYVCSRSHGPHPPTKVLILKENVFRNVEERSTWEWNSETEQREPQHPDFPEFAIKGSEHIEDWSWS